jgi:hypothetical protein
MAKDVVVSKDVLGWLLVWSRDDKGADIREGEPVTLPMSGDIVYFKSRGAAEKAAADFNAGRPNKAFNGAY